MPPYNQKTIAAAIEKTPPAAPKVAKTPPTEPTPTSSRGPYTTVSESKKSTFVPNDKLPEDASEMEKAGHQAKIDDVMKKAKLLKALKEAQEKEAGS